MVVKKTSEHPRWIVRLVAAVATVLVIGFVIASSFYGTADRNVPGKTTAPGRSSLVDP
jgi:hypothetical protein